MKKCINCGNDFETQPVIAGKKKKHYNRKYCLTCSPLGANNRRRLEDKKPVFKGTKVSCSICGREYPYRRHGGHTTTKCSSCLSTIRRREMKSRAVEYKGGSCSKCGYNKCFASLDFHHIDKSTKEFSIGGFHGSWETMKTELDKCVLLCRNCHGEEHSMY